MNGFLQIGDMQLEWTGVLLILAVIVAILLAWNIYRTVR